uniref:Dihydrofolate reductase n=1 Tax=Carcinus maenas virus 1 TaxID=2704945 RepID=A0A6G9HD96_9VIRU|nr:dihydrofolate reductase [Carcinus maenas virus 1]
MYFKKNLVLHITIFHNSTGDRLYDANGLKSCIPDPHYAEKKKTLILQNVKNSNVALLYGHSEVMANLKMLENVKHLYPTLQIYAIGASTHTCDDTFVYIKKNSLRDFFKYNSNDYTTVHVLGGLTIFESVLLHYSHLIKEAYVTDFYSGYDYYHPSDLLDRRLDLLLLPEETKEFIFNNDVVLPKFTYVRYPCTKNNNQFFRQNPLFKTSLASLLMMTPSSLAHHSIHSRATLRFDLTIEKYANNKYMTAVPSLGLFDPLCENKGEVEDYLNDRTVRNTYLLDTDKVFEPLVAELSSRLEKKKKKNNLSLLYIDNAKETHTALFYIYFIVNGGDLSLQIISDNVTLKTVSLYIYGTLKLFLNIVLKHNLHCKRLVLDFLPLRQVIDTGDKIFTERVINGCEKYVVYDLSEEYLTYKIMDA